jgi:hypothetical protein
MTPSGGNGGGGGSGSTGARLQHHQAAAKFNGGHEFVLNTDNLLQKS